MNFKQYQRWRRMFLIFVCISLVILIVPTGCSSRAPAPAPVPAPILSISLQFNRIAFADTSPYGDHQLDIYSMKTNGSDVVNLTRGQGGGRNDYPSWSPDGVKIVFLSSRGDYGREIYMMNADGSNQTRLTDGDHKDHPELSPDGTKIAYTMGWDIWVMNADGSNQTRLTDNPASDFMPCWSPDGTKIAFVSARDYTNQIYVMNADGSNQVRLTDSVGGNVDPSWSPYGTKIAFSGAHEGERAIYMMNVDGTNQTRLTSLDYTSKEPSWSPDGRQLVFSSDMGDFESAGIYVMSPNNPERTKLIGTIEPEPHPCWSPSASTPAPAPTPAPASTPAPAPAPVPAPTVKMFPFSLEADSDYSFSIYLEKEQTLHLEWWTEQGVNIWFGFMTPSGKWIGFHATGSLANNTLDEGHRSLLPSGVTSFSPSQYGWGTGYYEMLATAYSDAALVRVQYWIDEQAMPLTSLIWTYPELHSLGISAEPDFFHETVPRETLENPEWDPKELEEVVIKLAREYAMANPYVEPNHVCRHMAVELWQIFKDNNITSLIVVGNTMDQEEWRILFECDHAWLIVLGRNNLNLGVECTSGFVYSPSYMRAYEFDCELAYREHGPSSPQWETAKARYDGVYTNYEQHLEGYFHVSPANFLTSTILWFIP